MRLDPVFAERLPLLNGMTSVEQALDDPELAPRLMQFISAGQLSAAPEVAITTAVATGGSDPVEIRLYNPSETRTTAALLWVHGGGFTRGSATDPANDVFCSHMAYLTGSLVASVEYRLATGTIHYPLPHDDVVTALRWLRGSAAALSLDPARLVVGGDSAGGNLAAGAVLHVRDDDGWLPAVLTLAYPVLHPVLPPLARDLVASLHGVPDLVRFLPDDLSQMNRTYLGGHESQADGYAMPGLADLEGLCPVLVINSECDDLRASGEAFAAAAALAGVEMQQMTAKGMLHGFLGLPDDFPEAKRARRRIAAVVRASSL